MSNYLKRNILPVNSWLAYLFIILLVQLALNYIELFSCTLSVAVYSFFSEIFWRDKRLFHIRDEQQMQLMILDNNDMQDRFKINFSRTSYLLSNMKKKRLMLKFILLKLVKIHIQFFRNHNFQLEKEYGVWNKPFIQNKHIKYCARLPVLFSTYLLVSLAKF